jgi:hypothetical protein
MSAPETVHAVCGFHRVQSDQEIALLAFVFREQNRKMPELSEDVGPTKCGNSISRSRPRRGGGDNSNAVQVGLRFGILLTAHNGVLWFYDKSCQDRVCHEFPAVDIIIQSAPDSGIVE